jgi:hypothetical protein
MVMLVRPFPKYAEMPRSHARLAMGKTSSHAASCLRALVASRLVEANRCDLLFFATTACFGFRPRTSAGIRLLSFVDRTRRSSMYCLNTRSVRRAITSLRGPSVHNLDIAVARISCRRMRRLSCSSKNEDRQMIRCQERASPEGKRVQYHLPRV